VEYCIPQEQAFYRRQRNLFSQSVELSYSLHSTFVAAGTASSVPLGKIYETKYGIWLRSVACRLAAIRLDFILIITN